MKISILLPTRKRTGLVVKSLETLLKLAKDTSRIEILIAYDQDDLESKNFFQSDWSCFINQYHIEYKVFETERQGYAKLHRYINFLAYQSTGDWLMFWNDDALMLTENWDQLIRNEKDFFGLLRMPNVSYDHPFALFPVFPRRWLDEFGMVSPVTHSDWWIYQVCNSTNKIKDIPVAVFHDRSDVTGNNNDETFREISYSADGKDAGNPDDYIHPDRIRDLIHWINKMKSCSDINYFSIPKN